MSKIVAILIYIFIFFSCGTMNSSTSPDWIDKRPSDSESYIGIGGSNTGKKSDDYVIAMANARVDLASEIAVRISSSQVISSISQTGKTTEEILKENLIQNVDAELQLLKIVDSHYSSKSGYWVYLRLTKSDWNFIQQKEARALKSRVDTIIYDGNFDSIKSKLFTYASAFSIIDKSPYKFLTYGNLGDRQGLLYDLYLSEILDMLSKIVIKVPSFYTLNKSDIFYPYIELLYRDSPLPNFPLVLKSEHGDLLANFNVDKFGKFDKPLNSDFLQVGKNNIYFSIDFDALGLDNKIFEKKFAKKNVIVNRQSNPICVVVKNSYGIDTLPGNIKSVFAEKGFNIKFLDDKKSCNDFLNFNFDIKIMPKEYSIYIAKGTMTVELFSNNYTEFTYMSPIVKDGGVSEDQVIFRLINRLLKEFSEDEEFFKNIKKFL